MKKGFYSANVRKPAGRIPAEPAPLPEVQTKEVAKPTRGGWRELYKRHEKSSIFVAGAALAVILVALHGSLAPAPLRTLTLTVTIARFTLVLTKRQSPRLRGAQSHWRLDHRSKGCRNAQYEVR